jgi:peptide/nickel transport system substrate-binding protein
VKVRKALSYGINREEISEIVFFGLFEPAGISFELTSPFYTPEVSRRYAEHDPERARALLDEAGYLNRDGDGYREFSDGRRFEVTIDAFSNSTIPDITELIAEHWADIGVKVHLNVALQEILVPRRFSGEFEIHVTGAPANPFTAPEKFALTAPFEPFWHRNGLREGPAWLREITALIAAAGTTLDPAEKSRLVSNPSFALWCVSHCQSTCRF